jgi:hypothetical protein
MEPRRFGLPDVLLLVAVLAAAGGARAWYLLDQADGAANNGPIRVQDNRSRELAELVDNLRSGKGFVSHAPFSEGPEVTAHTSPGYPFLLAWIADWTEDWVDDWHVVVRWFQCGLGTLTAGLYFLFVRRAFQSLPAAMLAGLLCALHPFWVFNTADINDGVVTTFLLAAAVLLGARGCQASGPTSSLFFGFSLAALALVRAPLLPFAGVAMLWFLGRCRSIKRGWLCALLAFLGFTNGLVPWTLRNFKQFGDVIPIVDSAYFHLWVGNHAEVEGLPVDWWMDFSRSGESHPPPKKFEDLSRISNQRDRYNSLGPQLLETIQQEPGGTIQRRLVSGVAFVFGGNWFDLDHRVAQGEPIFEGWLLGSLLAMLLLGVLGWRWSYAWRRESMPLSLAVIWIPLPYFLSHAEALSGPRLPLDGALLCYAAVALAGITAWCVPGSKRTLLEGPPANPE